jgi:hypothetical protein
VATAPHTQARALLCAPAGGFVCGFCCTNISRHGLLVPCMAKAVNGGVCGIRVAVVSAVVGML